MNSPFVPGASAGDDHRRGDRPLVVTAHRGFSGRAPENTLAAFRAAIAAGCDQIELDVHLSRDGEVVVIHDDTLGRTTNGRGNVAERTVAELRGLDAGAWFSPAFAGERIPTLAEVLELTGSRIGLNIELKAGKRLPYTLEELAERTLAVVRQAGVTERVLFSSFSPAAIDRIRALDPGLPIALIVEKPWRTPAEADGGAGYRMLSCRTTVLNAANIRLAHAAGIGIHVWTVNAPGMMRKFIALGVDGIITNHPDRLLALLGGRREHPGVAVPAGSES